MKQVIFDLDGTLFQTGSCFVAAVRETLADFGLSPVCPEEITRHIGKTTRQFLHDFLPPGTDERAFAGALKTHEREALFQSGSLYHGVRELLTELSGAGFTLHILSSGSLDYIERVTGATDIAKFFTVLYSSRDYPDKSAVLKNIASNGGFAVMVGDRSGDFEAAKLCRLPSIAAAYGYASEEETVMADFRADTPAQIADRIFTLSVFHTLTSTLIGKMHGRLLGISGVDTSGKTEFCAGLARYLKSVGLPCAVLHLDDFHNPAALRRKGENEISAYFDNAFDLQKLESEVLRPLKTHENLHRTVRCLTPDTDKYDREITLDIEETELVLLEGVLLFRPPIDEYLDARIWLEISFNEVLRRARLRDVPKYGEAFLERYKSKYIPIQEKFIREYDPKGKSDAVIDNENYNRPEYLY